MAKLVVIVPLKRRSCGRAVLLSKSGETLLGPIRILATASRRVALKHGNPTCSPWLPFGHPPAGTYLVAGSLPPGARHRRPGRYGRLGALVLQPTGDAASGSGPQRRFALHGGPVDPQGRLRPTRGGLRVSDEDLSQLLVAINTAYKTGDPVSVVEIVEVREANPPDDVRDERGRRQVLGAARTRKRHAALPAPARAAGVPIVHASLLVAALGCADPVKTPARRDTRRRFLKSALLLLGAACATACSGDDVSPLPPVSSDPGEQPNPYGEAGTGAGGCTPGDGGVDGPHGGGCGDDGGGGYVSGGGVG